MSNGAKICINFIGNFNRIVSNSTISKSNGFNIVGSIWLVMYNFVEATPQLTWFRNAFIQFSGVVSAAISIIERASNSTIFNVFVFQIFTTCMFLSSL